MFDIRSHFRKITPLQFHSPHHIKYGFKLNDVLQIPSIQFDLNLLSITVAAKPPNNRHSAFKFFSVASPIFARFVAKVINERNISTPFRSLVCPINSRLHSNKVNFTCIYLYIYAHGEKKNQAIENLLAFYIPFSI